MALETPRLTVKLNDSKLKVVPVAAGALIFQGALAGIVGGFAVPASPDAEVILGMARVGADNRVGAAGDVTVEVERGVFAWENDAADPVTQASLGKPVYVVDDMTVAATDGAGTRPEAGILYQIDDAGIWVESR